MFRLSGWVWLVTGVCLGIAVVCYGLFQFYQPNMEEAKLIEDYAGELRTEAGKLKQAEKRQQKAIEYVESVANELRAVLDKKTANGTGFIDLGVDPFTLTMTAPAFRDKVQTAVNRQIKTGGVEVVNGPLIPFPDTDPATLMQSYFNFTRLPFPVVIFDLGTITVTGTYAQIVANVEGWTNMPDYFAVADGLVLTGTSPKLTATYAVSIVGFLPGAPNGPLAGNLVTGGGGPGGGGAVGGRRGAGGPAGGGALAP